MDSLEKRRNTYEKLNYYDLITLCIKRKDKIDELKKENERLLKKSYKDDVIITKAIEVLKKAGCYDEETKTFCDDVWEELPELLDILESKGE